MERLTEELRSRRNRLFWRLREKLRFCRVGYRESGNVDIRFDPEAGRLEMHYALGFLKDRLAPPVYLKNLATLYILERILDGVPLPPRDLNVLEPGCQDFARLPAIRAYLRERRCEPRITGVEVDAFPILDGFHSRADKARYYLSLPPGEGADRFVARDFFRWGDPAYLLLSFYPFVSTHPALAWGLPKEFGDPREWISAYERNLLAGGYLLVVHQGPWEEEAFDEAREGSVLELVMRANVDCRFYPLPHPACASLYRKAR